MRKTIVAGIVIALLATGRIAVPDGRGNVFVYRTPPTMINADPEQLQQQLSALAAREVRFRKLLTGEAALEDLDDAERDAE